MRPVGFLHVVLLSSLGLADTAQGQNCSVPVGGPNMELKNEDILKTSFPDGGSATFVCAVGYATAGGSGTITCTAGSWSVVRLQCERKDCGHPGEVPNGELHFNGTQFGDRIVATCNTGYILIGDRELLCGPNGWLNRLPTCDVVKCFPPPEVVNAETPSPSKDEYNFGEVVRYRCLKDYTLNGSATTSCQDDGKFKPGPPTCEMVRCDEPDVPNGHWDGGARPPYGYKAFVTYACNPGYIMKGQASLTCEIGNNWSPKPPQCIALTTTTKATTTTTTTTKSQVTDRVPRPPLPTDDPNNGAPTWSKSWWFILLVIVLVGGLFVCICCFKNRIRTKGHYLVRPMQSSRNLPC